MIGYLKEDGRLRPNDILSSAGDAMNTLLVPAEHNPRLILSWLRLYVLGSLGL
jgi:hypothetical protein